MAFEVVEEMAVGVKETKATIDLDLFDVNTLGHVIAARCEYCDVESVMEIWTILSRFQSRHMEVNKDVRTVIRHYCNIDAIVPNSYTTYCYYAKFKIVDH